MKKSFFIFYFFLISYLNGSEIESILRIKPETKYEQSLKYENINKYKEKKEDEKNNYDFGIDIDLNPELMTIEGFRIDIKTKF
ncbi:hypothetical protein [Arcobacter aquimarinus]|uniref:Uncharacterized protein n=1 Tax=Arcobacter aquimarinus TaxID=1315211 RepID=A0AAE7B3P7_9BACT|nr:hypothetical protein [Arcobacter aquimarinus]MCB9096564.1 hypothetical protein [Arcobacter sp.]QKE24905.1 hypothetical protein AAQM_0125 [Arcobacter aquimarinus]RXI36849.1 hypothetical protein CP986_00845 [Arcobacter aquimarinus]